MLLTIHVALSLIGIASGLIVLFAMARGGNPKPLLTVFLATTVLTSATGFFLPAPMPIDPARVVGGISLLLLAVALPAYYSFHLSGWWRPAFVVTATAALYFNCFVGVVQAFQKLSFLQPLAPTGSEPPFAAAQGALLLLMLVLGFLALRRYRPRMA